MGEGEKSKAIEMGYFTAYLNPFNHMSSAHIKLLPGDLGGGGLFVNAGPKALAFKADKKLSKVENKEMDMFMASLSEDGANAKYCNVYTFHGSAWGAIKRFLDRNKFLYMYDKGTVTNEYMMSVAVNWMAQRMQRQSPQYIRTLAAHFIGECVAARCCDTPCDKFGLGLYKMGERSLALNGGKLGDDYEESWLKDIFGSLHAAADADIVKWIGLVLHDAAMIAYEMSLHPDERKPMMNVKPQKYSSDTVKCWTNLMNGVPASLVGPNAVLLKRALDKLIVQAPKDILAMKAEERRKAIEKMDANAIAISIKGKKMSVKDIIKLKIINGM